MNRICQVKERDLPCSSTKGDENIGATVLQANKCRSYHLRKDKIIPRAVLYTRENAVLNEYSYHKFQYQISTYRIYVQQKIWLVGKM
jgi:hypothetical protein